MKKRKDGLYRKSITDKNTGKRIYFYGISERDINRKIYEYEQRAENGRTFKEVANEWWRLETSNLSPSTVKGYGIALNKVLDHFANDYIQEIKTSDITRFFHALKRDGYAKKTVKNHKIIIDRIFHYASVEGDIKFNVAREAEIPRGLPETKRLPATPIDENKIKNATGKGMWLLPFMALFTGMRKGELLGLQWGDIDLEKRLIHVRRSVWYDSNVPNVKDPKTEAGKRKIPILNLLYDELVRVGAAKQPKEHFVFGGEKPMTEKAFRYSYAKFQRETGITATAQQLRKSYATLAVGANVPADVLRAIFGHADVATTLNIYAEVRDERITSAADLLNSTPLASASAPSKEPPEKPSKKGSKKSSK